MTDTFPVVLAGPSSKERKYDRQLRLWAASGQQALEQSRVLLVNSDGPIDEDNTPLGGVVGVETLKNLVLPGIGGFTIVDPAVVTETDLGVNFFLEESSLGKLRAQETCAFLKELNPDVDGDYRAEPIAALLQQSNFLSNYKLIIVSGPIRRSSLTPLSHNADQLGIPLIYTRSVGFYSSFSLQLPAEFPIVDTHPDPESTQDLRLLSPWPELHAAGSAISNLDALDDHDHGHVPYILLLLHYLERWKAEHDGKAPESYKEKVAFRELVRAGARTNNPEGGEENFDEAVGAVLKSINPWSLRSNVREIFEMDQCINIRPDSDNFWIIAAALKQFYSEHSVLPLPGSLPDMKSRSADYISLQNIYKSKAHQDVEEVLAKARSLEAQLGQRSAPVDEKEVEMFCKNASHVKVVHGRRIPQIKIDASQTLKAIRSAFGNPDSVIGIYVAFEALDAIVDGIQEARLPPTALNDEVTWNATLDRLLTTIAEKDDAFLLQDEVVSVRETLAKAAQELRRSGGGELHNISSLTGGLVAQEALKVLTRQYVPLDNTCIFDGISSRSEMFRL